MRAELSRRQRRVHDEKNKQPWSMRELVLINAVARALALFSGVSSAEKRHVEIAKRLLSQNGGPLYGRRPPDPKLETLIA